MEIKLISDITVRPIQSCGGDHMVVAAAKVSTTGEDALKFADPSLSESNAGLINFLMKMRHGTPFEHASITFFVHVPAFVWWEWVRHRIGHSYNLESSRYKKLEPVFWLPRIDRKIRPAEDHKPGRPKFTADSLLAHKARNNLTLSYKESYKRYESMIDDGVSNEVARAALPFAVYFSGWVTVNPRSLMSFLSLRTQDESAQFISYPQAEIEEAARSAEKFLTEGWPITYRAFVKNGRVAP